MINIILDPKIAWLRELNLISVNLLRGRRLGGWEPQLPTVKLSCSQMNTAEV